MKKTPLTFPDYLKQTTEFKKYGKNDLAVFALSMYLGIDDIDEFVSNSWTEDDEDKKIDVFYINPSESRAAIVQIYISDTFGRVAALANKASDLNTACSWVFSASEKHIPQKIRSKAIELRNAIIQNEIERIDFLYVHNCMESGNVESELRTVTDGARDKIIALSGKNPLEIHLNYKEIGVKTIEDLYKSKDKEILVEDTLVLPKKNYIEEKGEGWKAIHLTVNGNWIRKLYLKNGDNLFSANYRDYLGSFKRKGNINFEMTKTAETEPQSFWVYNNGVTALTSKISLKKHITINGLSIINGAQTTGSIGETSEKNAKLLKVPFRVVECKDKATISKIIKYNNTQNEIKAFDKRSNDPIQKRLSKYFHDKYSINYIHRRTQTRVPKKAITAFSIAPALCSFHGDPSTAHRQAKEIFLQDDIYNRVFNDLIAAEHIFLIRALSVSIDQYKEYLSQRVRDNKATDLDSEQLDLLKYSASKTFIFYIVGRLAEIILNKKVTSLYNWKAKADLIAQDNISLTNAWTEILQTILPQLVFVIKKSKLSNPFYEVPRSLEESKRVGDELKALLASQMAILGKQFINIRKRSVL